MAGEQFSAQAMRRSAGALHSDGQGGEATVGESVQAISGVGPCWGTDAAGQAFGKAYLPAAVELLIASAEATAQVQDLGNRLDQSARAYESTESRATDTAKQAGR